MYTPKFTDPRVKHRVKSALGWANLFLSPTSPCEYSRDYLDKVLGQNDLGAYLRKKVLTTYSQQYTASINGRKVIFNAELKKGARKRKAEDREDGNECKSYLRNEVGCAELLREIDGVARTCHAGNSDLQVDRFSLEYLMQKHGDEILTGNFSYLDKHGDKRLSHPMQNIRRDKKKQVWSMLGFVADYDVVASAPSLILQEARLSGFTKSVPTYDAYLNDRNELRKYVSDLLGVHVDIAKKVVNGLFNGMRKSQRPEDTFMQLLTSKDIDVWHAQELVRRTGEDARLKKLSKEIQLVWSHIRQIYFPQQKKVTIARTYHAGNSDLQVSYQRVQPLSGSQRWSFYFSLERRVLDAVRAYLVSIGCAHFLEHDGWKTKVDIPVQVFEEVIEKATKFTLKIEKVSYEHS